MEWQLSSSKVIVHDQGHSIELKSGSWQEPFDIHPRIKKGTPSIQAARLIREGLAFASNQSVKSKTPC